MRILVIDDDATLTGLLQHALNKAGYKVSIAYNGIDGLQLLYAEQPDLIILDVMMPRMDGWETAQRIRKLSKTPIIMLTAKDLEQDKLKGFACGVDDYVTKPFSFAELTARVGAVLARSQAGEAKAERIHSGELVIDADAHRVLKNGKPIALTPTEFKLLLTLAQNSGRVLTHAQLVEHVWGYEADADEDYVKRFIWYLRHKIEDNPSQPVHITTERGVGYRFEGDPT